MHIFFVGSSDAPETFSPSLVIFPYSCTYLSAALLKLSRKMEHGRCQSFFCPLSISGMAHGMTAENYGCLVK